MKVLQIGYPFLAVDEKGREFILYENSAEEGDGGYAVKIDETRIVRTGVKICSEHEQPWLSQVLYVLRSKMLRVRSWLTPWRDVWVTADTHGNFLYVGENGRKAFEIGQSRGSSVSNLYQHELFLCHNFFESFIHYWSLPYSGIYRCSIGGDRSDFFAIGRKDLLIFMSAPEETTMPCSANRSSGTLLGLRYNKVSDHITFSAILRPGENFVMSETGVDPISYYFYWDGSGVEVQRES